MLPFRGHPSHLQNGFLWTSSTLPRVTTVTGMPKTPPQNGPWFLPGSKAPASFEDRSDRRLIPVNRPESPLEFWTKRVGSFNEVLFFGAVGYLKRSRTGMMDSSHLLMLIIWPLFFWSDLKPKKHVFHKLFFTPAYFWIVSQKSGTFIFFNPAWLLKQLHSLCDLLSLTRNQIWLPR